MLGLKLVHATGAIHSFIKIVSHSTGMTYDVFHILKKKSDIENVLTIPIYPFG